MVANLLLALLLLPVDEPGLELADYLPPAIGPEPWSLEYIKIEKNNPTSWRFSDGRPAEPEPEFRKEQYQWVVKGKDLTHVYEYPREDKELSRYQAGITAGIFRERTWLGQWKQPVPPPPQFNLTEKEDPVRESMLRYQALKTQLALGRELHSCLEKLEQAEKTENGFKLRASVRFGNKLFKATIEMDENRVLRRLQTDLPPDKPGTQWTIATEGSVTKDRENFASKGAITVTHRFRPKDEPNAPLRESSEVVRYEWVGFRGALTEAQYHELTQFGDRK